MKFLHAMRLLLWKNCILRGRHKMAFICEFFVPVYFFGQLCAMNIAYPNGNTSPSYAYMNSKGTNQERSGPSSRTTGDDDNPMYPLDVQYSEQDILNQLHSRFVQNGSGGVNIIGFYPSTETNFNITEKVRQELIAGGSFTNIEIRNFTEEQQMETYFQRTQANENKYRKNRPNLLFGIVFEEGFSQDGVGEKVSYKIRANHWNRVNTKEFKNTTNEKLQGFNNSKIYQESGILGAQLIIDKILIQEMTKDDFWDIKRSLKGFPRSQPMIEETKGRRPGSSDSNIFGLVYTLYIMLCFMPMISQIIGELVAEKEIGTKELMKMCGLPEWIHWAGWFLNSVMSVAFIVTFVTFCLWIRLFIEGRPAMFHYSDPTLIWVYLMVYGMYVSTFCFLVSSCMSEASVATTFGVILYLFSLGPGLGMSMWFKHLSILTKLCLCICPNVALGLTFTPTFHLEKKGIGAQWSSAFESPPGVNAPPMAFVILAVIAASGVNMLLAGYLEAIMPKEFGVRKSPFFIFKPSEWKECCGGKRGKVMPVMEKEQAVVKDDNNEQGNEVDNDSTKKLNPDIKSENEITEKGSKQTVGKKESTLRSKDGFEDEPNGMVPGIQIMNLRKQFGHIGKKKVAVDDLTVNMFEGQIFCLLGENGAGKTTTMSILTGIMSQTSGFAKINGLDIHSGIDQIRKSLGLCPQHNMLFDKLTSIEHLKFFGALKGLTMKQAEIEGRILLRSMNLSIATLKLASELSGGQKRKLQLACALIGGPKILILDEPSSGLDAEARRAVWDVLVDYKKDRTILLTTHFMEEADYLGDRIGIMCAGRLRCCGSPSYLKKFYGAGFTLNMSIKDGTDREKILKTVEKHVEGAVFKDSYSGSSNELSIVLPPETAKFPALFKDLRGRTQELNIAELGMSWTTMDDVFVKVNLKHSGLTEQEQKDLLSIAPKAPPTSSKTAIKVEKELNPQNQLTTENKSEEIKSEASGGQISVQNNIDTPADAEQASAVNKASLQERSWGLVFRQSRGLFVKNVLMLLRRKLVLFVQVIVPIVVSIAVALVGVAMLDLPTPPFDYPIMAVQPVRQLTLKEYQNWKIIHFSDSNPNSEKIAKAYEKVVEILKWERIGDNYEGNLENIIKNNANDFRKKYLAGAEITTNSEGETSLIARHSNIALHSAPLSINLLTNALLQARMDGNFSIKTSIHPFHDPNPRINLTRVHDYPTESGYQSTGMMLGMILSYFLTMALALFVSNFVKPPTEERLAQGKLLQLMTGIHPLQYWSSYFLVDSILTILVISVMITMISVFEEHRLYSNNGGLVILYMLFLVYCLAIIPLSYIYSTCVKSPSEGFRKLVCLHIFSGIFIANATQMISFAVSNQAATVAFSLLGILFPSFLFTRAITSYASTALKNVECVSIAKEFLNIICHKKFDSSATEHEAGNGDNDERNPRDRGFTRFLHCCPNCQASSYSGSSECFEVSSYFKWTETSRKYGFSGGAGVNVTEPCLLLYIALFVVIAIVYIGLLMLKESEGCGKSKKILGAQLYPQLTVVDEDVLEESSRVQYMVDNRLTAEDALVVFMLSKVFNRFWAVSGLNFGVHYGECFGLLGVNGAGKTTAFKMLAGDLSVTFGDAFMAGMSLSNQRNKFRGRLGYCPQFDAINKLMTGKEMLYLYGRLRGLEGSKVKEEAEKWLERTKLGESANVWSGKYSGGMKRRLSIAMALIGDPPIILLDEPTSGVDPVARRQFWKIIAGVKNTGQAVILTSHSMEECEALCSRLGIMVNSELQCFGGVQHLKNKFAQGYSLTVQLNKEFLRSLTEEVPPVVEATVEVTPAVAGKEVATPTSPQQDPATDKSNQQQTAEPVAPTQENEVDKDKESAEIEELIKNIVSTFESCEFKERHTGTLKFQIYNVANKLTWDELYSKMEQTKTKNQEKIEEYAIFETSLEEVFLAFAKLQKEHVIPPLTKKERDNEKLKSFCCF